MKNRKILKSVIRVLLIAVLGYSIYKIYSISRELIEVDQTYKGIQAEYIVKDSDTALEGDQAETGGKESGTFGIRWKELLEKNADVVAWIQIPDTDINYPVLQGKTNNEYLRHDLDRKYLIAGSIFVDSHNIKPFVDFNTVIYGHNMQNGSMFSDLRKFSKKKFADQHQKVLIYLPNDICLTYEIISFHVVQAESADIYNTNVIDKAAFLNCVKENNQLESSIDETKISSIITLSTCTNGKQEERYVLHAALLKSLD